MIYDVLMVLKKTWLQV